MHNERKFFILAVLVLSLQSTSVSAAANDWYVGAKVNWNNANSACEVHATSCNNNTIGGGIYAGYKLNDWLDLEGGYDYLGSIDAYYPALGNQNVSAHYKGEIQGFEFVAKPFWKVSKDVAWFAKMGAFAWNMDVTGDEIDFEHAASDNGWSPLLGTGVEYAFNRNWSTLLEYEWINNVGGSSTGGTDINMISLGVTYHFSSERPVEPPVPAAAVSIPNEIRTVKEKDLYFVGASFVSNSTELSSELKQALQSVVQRLRTYPQATALIKTHTDGRGTVAFNQKLSDERADSILSYLMEQGCVPTQLRAIGYGESQPVADDSTSEGRSKNRRVEVISPEFEVEQEKIIASENQQ